VQNPELEAFLEDLDDFVVSGKDILRKDEVDDQQNAGNSG